MPREDCSATYRRGSGGRGGRLRLDRWEPRAGAPRRARSMRSVPSRSDTDGRATSVCRSHAGSCSCSRRRTPSRTTSTGSRASPPPRARAPRWPGPTGASCPTTTPGRPSGSSSTSCTGPNRASSAFETRGATFETTLFSNVNAAIPRWALERFPFRDDLTMSEDQEWSRRALRAGFSLVYEPRAAVRHSHAYTIRSAFRRFFDSGVSAEHAYVEGDASRAALRRAGARYARAEVAWLWSTGRRRWIPYTAAYELGKYAGLQLGLRHARLPRSLVRRLGSYETG